MKDFAGKTAIGITGGGAGIRARAGARPGRRGLQRGDLRRRPATWPRRWSCAWPRGRRKGPASPPMSPTSQSDPSFSASATSLPKRADRQTASAVQQCRHRRRLDDQRPARGLEKTFNVCWGGVYLGVRTFLPTMMRADEAHIVNTSSVSSFWASLGPNMSHTAYAAAKFAVKGFSEALITDLRLNAPASSARWSHGHIGTSIAVNTRKVMSGNGNGDVGRGAGPCPPTRTAAGIAHPSSVRRGRPGHGRRGAPGGSGGRPDDRRGRGHGDPRRGQGRAVGASRVGEDAHRMDEMVRAEPESATNRTSFSACRTASAGGWAARSGYAPRFPDDAPAPVFSQGSWRLANTRLHQADPENPPRSGPKLKCWRF